MHPIDIGISGYHDVVISQIFNAFVDIQCGLQQVELLVFIDDFLCESVAVERFAAQREHSLCLRVAALGDASRRGVALGDEQRRF